MKTCIRCNVPQPIENFYKHNMMADGHLNVCKECVKKRVSQRYAELLADPSFVESERRRHREKFHRLGKLWKKDKSRDLIRSREFRSKFPEKYKAHTAASQIECPSSHHRHHWSYQKEHWLDVIILTVAEHAKLHRYIRYDKDSMMYRTLSGTLLDSKEKHVTYMNEILVLQD